MLVIVIAVILMIVIDMDSKISETNLDAQPPVQATEHGRLVSFRDAARAAGIVFELPDWPQTPEAVLAIMQQAISASNERLDRIAEVKPFLASFRNTVQSFETALYPSRDARGVAELIAAVHPLEAMRAAARDSLNQYNAWMIEVATREDVYTVIKTFADTEPPLGSEDGKLLRHIMRDYRRNGMELAVDKREELLRLKAELAVLENEFSANLVDADAFVELTPGELGGISSSILDEIATVTDAGHYRINVNISWQFEMLMKLAGNESTRHKLVSARLSRAAENNSPLVKKMLMHRSRIAGLLGYDSWSDYQTKVAMAGSAKQALEFQQRLQEQLETRYLAELDALAILKAEDTCDIEAEVNYWDVPYYVNQLKRTMFGIDAEELKNYFSLESVLKGMMDTFSTLFGIQFTRIQAPDKWVDSLQLYAISDTGSGVPLGLLYLDLLPRPGKFSHFAHFGITEGKRLHDGRRQRPVSVLVGNFTPPRNSQPSLLSLEELDVLFHEFGHALHALMSTATYARFSGTNVPADFVEVPSQLMEYWMRDPSVVQQFAVDYRDPENTVPVEVLENLEDARLASIALFERRQLAFSLIDTHLHRLAKPDKKRSLNRYANKIASKAYLDFPEDASVLASFSHLVGYDGTYYGYAWSRAIAADLVSAFWQSPDGLMDAGLGWRLREEIFAPGSSRSVEYSVESFLGRKHSMQVFLDSIGIQTDDVPASGSKTTKKAAGVNQ